MHLFWLAVCAPALFIEDEDRRFGDSPRRDVELALIWKLAPAPRTIVEGVEPPEEGLRLFGWNSVDGQPCAADVAYRKTGLCQQCTDLMAERSRRNDGEKVPNRESVELVKTISRPGFEVRRIPASESPVQEAPGIVDAIEVRDLTMQGVGFEWDDLGQTPSAAGVDDCQLPSPFLDDPI